MLKNNIERLYIRKRTASEWLVFSILILPFVFATLIEFFHFPDIIRFVIDGFLAFFVISFIIKKRLIVFKSYYSLLILVTVFFIYTLIVYFANYQSVFYYIWGFRNNFRFYIAFFVYVLFFSEEDAENYLKLFDIIFWINFVVCLIQYFVLSYEQDNLGGLFGVERGCNAYINLFFCIVVTKSFIYYLNKKEKIWVMILKFAAALIIVSLAELKFFYIEIIVIVCAAVLITDFTWRKLFIIFITFVGVAFGIIILTSVFPQFANYFVIDSMIASLSSDKGYTNSQDINRLTALPIISKNILTEFHEKIFGLGLGNCDLSSIELLNTPFYNEYSQLNYNWFSVSFLFLETGYIGLLIFILFYIICFILCLKMCKSGTAGKDFCHLAMIMCIICILSVMYNSALRLEIAYVVYFVLALPFISVKRKNTYNLNSDNQMQAIPANGG